MAGVPNKLQKTKKSRLSDTKINPNASIDKIKPVEEKTDFFCVCCGKSYKVQKNNFLHTMSPLFAANGGYLPVCKNCVNKYYEHLLEFFTGNEEKAIERVAQIADWYYNDEIWASTRKISADRSRVNAYPSKMQLPQYKDKGTTYLDTVKDRYSVTIDSMEDFKSMKEAEQVSISERTIKRWGLGYSDDEYQLLNEHYKMLKEQIDVTDFVQEKLIKDLCEIKIQQDRARQANDADRFEKFVKQYQATLKSANIKAGGVSTDYANDESACWGTFIRDIEQYTPADVYMEKSLFKDVDKITEYFNRFIVRPFKNFFSGSSNMDEEFSIKPGDTDDEA